jgi:hypothetical protein
MPFDSNDFGRRIQEKGLEVVVRNLRSRAAKGFFERNGRWPAYTWYTRDGDTLDMKAGDEPPEGAANVERVVPA